MTNENIRVLENALNAIRDRVHNDPSLLPLVEAYSKAEWVAQEPETDPDA